MKSYVKNRNFCVKWMAAGLGAALALSLTACGSANDKSFAPGISASEQQEVSYSSESVNYGYDSVDMNTSAANGGAEFSGMDEGYSVEPAEKADNSAYFDSRKLIRTVNLDVETQEFDGLLDALEAQVEQLGGYIESMNTYNGSRYSYSNSYSGSYSNREAARNSNLTVRIPQKQLSGFVDAVSAAGNVVSRTENVEDVTLSYVDIESRKKALETELERLQSFLERAESLEDIITLEDRMSTVRYQLESMASQLRTYDNKVDFATVYLSIREVKELTPVEEETAWERLTGGFMESLENVKDGFVEFFIWIVVHIPYLAVWAVVILIIVVVIKLIIRRSRRKKAAKREAAQRAQAASAPAALNAPANGEQK